MRTGPVVTFGETMLTTTVDAAGPLRVGAQGRVSFAGAESTVAIGLARLGHPVIWCGRVGDDAPGRLIVQTLAGEGVQVRGGVDGGAPTGAMLRYRRAADRVEAAYQRLGTAASRLRAEEVVDALAGADLLHLTGITPALGPAAKALTAAVAAAAQDRGVPMSLDVNYRARLWSPEQAAAVLAPLARSATLVFGGPEELELVAGARGGSAVDRLIDQGVAEVVLKDGAQGAVAAVDGERFAAPARAVSVRDVLGAGDCFVAGYLSGRADGLDVPGRLARATVSGAWSVSCEGDWEGQPTRAELSGPGPGGDVLR